MQCKRYSMECKKGCTNNCALKNTYRPSNGTEGMIFEENFCSACIHQNPDPTKNKNCDIAMRAFCFDVMDKEYPNEWRYDPLGHPTCTAYVNWNWGQNGDPDDPDNPNKPPDPPDPNQLHLFPLYPSELVFEPLKEMIHG